MPIFQAGRLEGKFQCPSHSVRHPSERRENSNFFLLLSQEHLVIIFVQASWLVDVNMFIVFIFKIELEKISIEFLLTFSFKTALIV